MDVTVAEPPRRRWWGLLRGTRPAWYGLALSLAATALGWYFTYAATSDEARQRFETETRAIQTDLIERLKAYEQVLRGGVSVFYTWPSVTRDDWRNYVEHLEIAQNYPGIQGIGFSLVVPPDDRQAHERRIRAQGFPDYRIWPEGERETYTAIIYLEPFDWRNQRAFGYDMFQQPVRREAMERARDTGLASLTAKVILVQETDQAVQAGFLMYLPVYRTPSPEDAEARRRQLVGYVYSPFRMRDFMRGLLSERERQVAMQVYDGRSTSNDSLMYTTRSQDDLGSSTPFAVSTVPLELAGRVWTLRFSALPSLSRDRSKPLIVAVGGLVVSGLLWAILWFLAKNRSRAAAANRQLEADIARRKQAEARLRDAETSFRYLFEKNPNAMWVFDRETLAIIAVNDAATIQYGYSHEEFRNLRLTDLRPAEDVPRLTAYMRDRPPGVKEAGEWRHVTKAGEIIEVEVASYPLEFQHRPSVLVVSRDITHRKRAQAALEESEAVARGVLDAALDAYVRMDQHGLITEWNAMAEQTFGWTRDEVVGRPLADILVPGRRSADGEAPPSVLAPDEDSILNRRIEIQTLHRSGRKLPVEVSMLALNTDRGRIFSAFLRDLTESREAEAQLRQAQKMETVGQLSGGVAHDFNNLLTVIIGNLEHVEPWVSEHAPAANSVQQALEAAEKGAGLAHRLLAFSRQQVLQPIRADVNQIIGGMVDLLRRSLGEDIEIEVRLKDDLWPCLADKGQLESALLNFTLNARDAMPAGGKLTIETDNIPIDAEYAVANPEVEAGDYVMLAVTDTGTGMPPDVVERALDPFFTTKEVGKGSGLGLSMTYGFAKQSRGHLKIYSEVGYGTTVKLYLPRTVDPQSEAAPRPVVGLDLRGNETILVVEDEPALRELVVGNLRSLGYNVLEAGNGVQAVAVLNGPERIDLLFTDVVLPGDMTGRRLAEEARDLHPEIRVLFTSGYPQNSMVHQGRLEPGVRLLSKPYRRQDLGRWVREVLDAPPATGGEP